MKVCNSCREAKPLSEYSKMSASPDGHQYRCRPCMREYKRKWERENVDRLRVQQLHGDIRRYGIEPEDYYRMLANQGGVCVICKGKDPRGDRLHIDHCHTTGRVRGLLCGRCNRGIGMFKDSPELLQLAAAYLQVESNAPGVLPVMDGVDLN